MDLLNRRGLRALGLLGCALTVACIPELDERGSLVSGPRILGVRAEPAESVPGTPVLFDVLAVDPGGPLAATTTLDWAFCNDAVPLDQIAPVSSRCLVPSADWLTGIGSGEAVTGTIPAEACRLFGPTPADRPAGEPAARPVDPDSTSGYYQPLRILVPISEPVDYVTFRARVRCGVVGLTQEQSAELTRRSRPNRNPVVDALAGIDGTGERTLAPDMPQSVTVSAGATLRLQLRWPACPSESECGGAEQYAIFDPVSRTIVSRREQLRVSWFASAGRYRDERTTSIDDAPRSENDWVAPDSPGTVRLWVVLRDDRGGTTWQSYQLEVTP